MNPKIGDAKVDKILSQFSQMYRNDTYISESIFPTLKVVEKTGKFAKYGKDNMRPYTGMIVRAPGTRAHSVDYNVSQNSYSCTEKSLEKLVPDEMANNTDKPYEAKRDATEILMDNIWINQELATATALIDTGIITQNVTLSGTDQWTDINSDPLADIDTGINTVRTATGKIPNQIVFGFKAWQKFRAHPDVREQVKYTNGGSYTNTAIKAFLMGYFEGITEVVIGNAVYNSADEGQTDVLTDVWGGNVWMFYKTPRPSIMQATFGYTFFDVARQADVYREEPKLSDVVRQRYSYDACICDASLAYLIKSAVT